MRVGCVGCAWVWEGVERWCGKREGHEKVEKAQRRQPADRDNMSRGNPSSHRVLFLRSRSVTRPAATRAVPIPVWRPRDRYLPLVSAPLVCFFGFSSASSSALPLLFLHFLTASSAVPLLLFRFSSASSFIFTFTWRPRPLRYLFSASPSLYMMAVCAFGGSIPGVEGRLPGGPGSSRYSALDARVLKGAGI